MKASAVLNDKDVWAISSQPSTNQSFLFSSFFLMGELKKRWLLRLMAARPVSRMKKLMELIYEWSLKGRWESEPRKNFSFWLSEGGRSAVIEEIDWFVFGFIGGLWAARRQWLRQKEANKDRKSINEFNEGRKKERKRIKQALLERPSLSWREKRKRRVVGLSSGAPRQLHCRGKPIQQLFFLCW